LEADMKLQVIIKRNAAEYSIFTRTDCYFTYMKQTSKYVV